jgi:hypothetical protein
VQDLRAAERLLRPVDGHHHVQQVLAASGITPLADTGTLHPSDFLLVPPGLPHAFARHSGRLGATQELYDNHYVDSAAWQRHRAQHRI